MKKYLVEFTGTFLIALTALMTLVQDTGMAAPTCIGLLYVAMIYVGRPVSGAHFNPAITVAALIRGTIDRTDFIYYMLVQCLGGLLAIAIGTLFIGCIGRVDIRLGHYEPICALLAELIGTFAVALVWIQMSEKSEGQPTASAGIPVGAVISGGMFALKEVSGAVFNPAIAITLAGGGLLFWSAWWIYAAGGVLGAAAAATLVQYLNKPDIYQ